MVNNNQNVPPPFPQANVTPPSSAYCSQMALDVPYATRHERQKLDVYLPVNGERPYRVFLLINGGGWRSGNKRDDIAAFAEPMLDRGYAVVAMNHRSNDDFRWPAQIFDAKAAVRWIRGNASRYGFDMNKIISIGSSSGGHLSAMLGTSGGVKELEDLSMGNPDPSSRVNLAVVLSGPIDFLLLDIHTDRLKLKSPFVHDSDTGPETMLIGGRPSKFPERCRAANPVNYIMPDAPPFYIEYTEHIPYLQGEILADTLKAVLGEDKVVFDNRNSPDRFAALPEGMDTMMAFIDKHLK